MRIRSKGTETRFDSVPMMLERERSRSAGVGYRMNYKKWCPKCGKMKLPSGSKMIAKGVYICADCQ